MVKKVVLFSLILAAMMAMAACGGAPAGGTTGGSVPETGNQNGADNNAGNNNDGGTTGSDAGSSGDDDSGSTTGGTAATCVGVDTQQLMTAGQTFYGTGCAGCHGEQGEGSGDFPALAGNSDLTAEGAADLVETYLSVPAHPKTISADDLAAVLTFARASFGNTGQVICPADVVLPATQ